MRTEKGLGTENRGAKHTSMTLTLGSMLSTMMADVAGKDAADVDLQW